MNSITEAARRLLGGSARAGGATATWNGVVIAESDQTTIVEGNHYFAPQDVKFDYLERSERHTICPWKGQASYYDVVVDGKRDRDAAWYYPSPSPAANKIKNHVAFWHGVKVTTTQRGEERGG